MRATLAIVLATLLTLSRYPTEYISGTLGPAMWVIPTLLLIRYADGLGLGQGFAAATGLGLPLAAAYLLLGALYWNYVEGVWSVALTIRHGLVTGTLESLWATPAPRLSLILGWSLGRLLGITLYSAAGLGILRLIAPAPDRAAWGLAALILVNSILAAYGFAFMLAGLSLWLKDGGAAVSMLGNAAPLLGGVVFPVALLPLPLRALSYLFPFTYGADALRGVMVGSHTLLPLEWELGLVIAMGAVLPLVGWQSFVRLERRARRGGLQGF